MSVWLSEQWPLKNVHCSNLCNFCICEIAQKMGTKVTDEIKFEFTDFKIERLLGSNVITKFLKCRRQRQKGQRQSDRI